MSHWQKNMRGCACTKDPRGPPHRAHCLSPPPIRTLLWTRQGCYFGIKTTFLNGVTIITFKTYSDCPLSCITWNLPCSARHLKSISPSLPTFFSQTQELANSPRALADVFRACSGHSCSSTSLLCSICCMFLLLCWISSLSETNILACVRKPLHFTNLYKLIPFR